MMDMAAAVAAKEATETSARTGARWYAGGFRVAKPSKRIVVVTVFKGSNPHKNPLGKFAGGKEQPARDDTVEDTFRNEHVEETGIKAAGPLKLIAEEWREGPRVDVPHWFYLFRGADITDEELDLNLAGVLNGSDDTVMNFDAAKKMGKEREFIGMVPWRPEIASCLTAEQILADVDGKIFVPYYRRLAMEELQRIAAE